MPITKLTRKAVEEVRGASGQPLPAKLADRCRNFFAMGLVYWLYGRDLDPTLRFIRAKFSPEIAEANEKALRAGWNYAETAELMPSSYNVGPAKLPPGTYRNLTGSQAMAWGLMAAAELSGKEMFYASYPITPASAILEELSRWKRFGVRTFQAEDEIATMTAIIGAAFGGAMAVTASSGPGIALKGEAMGLAMMLELPLLIVNVQRGGPSTGLPTKTEQSDLFQALFGRNGESPLPVIAARSPGRLLRHRPRSLADLDALHGAGNHPARRLARERRRALVHPATGIAAAHTRRAPGPDRARRDVFSRTRATSGCRGRGRCPGRPD